ncbi:MAG: GGDEF domain-containing protein [Gammaproteobacteria bacterium]|nr:GGDEF domain-containing protein [Gammaproteobacteria bacterium]
MAKQLNSDNTKLSLVSDRNHASAFIESQPKQDSIEAVAASLPAILQTSLDLDDVIGLFHKQINNILNYDSFNYQHQGVHCDITIGTRSHHSCNYRLEMNGVWLGEITFTRRIKFDDFDSENIENLLCKLIYPLRNSLLYRQAQSAALTDGLTGLNNRAAFDSSLQREIGLAHRQQTPMSLIVLDIDNFKVVNDTYGHSSGDQALKSLAEVITETMRGSDIAFRYGGEEFVLILSNTDAQAAVSVAERIRVAASQLFCTDGKRSFGFTISLGVAQLNRGEKGSALFDRADHALYQAKKAGRNQTIQAKTA